MSYEADWESALIHFLATNVRSRTHERAHDYLNDRLFDFIIVPKGGLSCLVEGNSATYETTLVPISGKLRTDCECPVSLNCKHALALALLLAWNARSFGHVIPPEIITSYAKAFRILDEADIVIPEINEIFGSATTKAPPPLPDHWWEIIATNPEWPEQKRVFQEIIRRRIPGCSFWNIDNIAASLKEVKNPIRRLKSLDRKIREFQQRYAYKQSSRIEPEPELLAFYATPQAAELEEKYERELAQADLMSWLHGEQKSREDRQQTDRLEITWTSLPVRDGFFSLYFQVKADAGQRGMMARKPNGILQIGRDIETGSRDFGAAQNKLISWISKTHCNMYSYQFAGEKSSDETMIPVGEVYQWVSAWSKYVHWHDGGTIAFSPYTAELTLSAADHENPGWVVKFPAHAAAEAREIPFADAAILVDKPEGLDDPDDVGLNYFVREGNFLTRVETHGMSPVVLRAIRKLGVIPMNVLAGTPAGSALFHVLSRGRKQDELSRWTQEIPCRAEVELAMTEKSDFIVTARARAAAAEGPVFLWKPNSGWRLYAADQQQSEDDQTGDNPDEGMAAVHVDLPSKTGGDELTSGDDPDEPTPAVIADETTDPKAAQRPHLHSMPRREDVSALEDWLDDVVSCVSGLNFPAPGQSVSGRLGTAGVAAFLPLWFQRPPGIEYFGNPEFRKMITVRAAPRISIKSEASGLDWLKVSVSLEEEINQTSFAEMSRVLAVSAENFVRLPNGGIYRRAELEEYRAQLDYLNALGLGTGPDEQKLHALHLAGAPAGALARLEAGGGALAALAEKSRQILRDFSGIPDAPLASETGDFLRPYQRAGVNFLAWAADNFGGALLADDMGLGKTLQMLATILSLREKASSAESKNSVAPGPTLVVCPASVAHNWEREAQRFAPGLSVLVLERGAGRRKQLEQLEKYDLVIMNFALLRRDITVLQPIKWFVIVVDEAQAIKNANSESSRALKQLEARYRFAMTGTPIENRISDLYSIVEFALPGYLGELDKSTSSTDPESAARACQLLRSRLRPVLTRRLKAEVAPELPERVETRIDCDMGGPQKKLYAAEVKRVRMMLDGMTETGVKGKHRIEMLAALMRLRQICCDPLLLGHPEIPSGKTEELLELVPPLLEAGHKVLIFSQFVKMLNHLEEQLTEKGIRPYKLTGATTNRQDLVDKFENDPEPAAFLISLKAGGTGLNLVSASHVILFDPWWNPSVEAQAIDRTHRIGQDKTVVAYRLVTQGTIEERILELQEKKRALVRNILEEDSFNRTLTSEDFQYLLGG